MHQQDPQHQRRREFRKSLFSEQSPTPLNLSQEQLPAGSSFVSESNHYEELSPFETAQNFAIRAALLVKNVSTKAQARNILT